MEKINQFLPNKPGVYLFKDENNRVLYVGKAKNLKSRVGSYLINKHLDRPWIAVMMGLIKDVETIVVNNELEALILEATLINEHQPKFNIKLTDDKAYPYIKLTLNESFPRFQIVRQRARDGAKYFGPYLSAWSARMTCEFLRRIYGVHISNRPLSNNGNQPCLNCQLENNLCPIANQISEEAYAYPVKKVIEFLEGRRKLLVKDIEIRMEQAAKGENFELAAKLRDQLRAVRQVTTNQDVVGSISDNFDAIAASNAKWMGVVTLMSVRLGILTGQKHFNFKITANQRTCEVIRQFLLNFYQNFTAVPPLVALAEDIEDRQLIESWLTKTFGHKVELRVAARGEKNNFVALAKKNADAKLEAELAKDNNDFSGLIAIKELLGLDEFPERIEAVDISNLGTSEPIGTTVCFINGQPDKNEYRRYKIRTVLGQNDFAMIREITGRRFSDTSRPVPDLFVVDGGPEQLKSALRALEGTVVKPKHILSLAKKPDRIFLPTKKRPIPIKRGHQGLLLLARIRDETHRFGLRFQRQRQNKKSLATKD